MKRKNQKTVLISLVSVLLFFGIIIDTIKGEDEYDRHELDFSFQDQIIAEIHKIDIFIESLDEIHINELLILRNLGLDSVNSIVLMNNHVMYDLIVKSDESALVYEEYNSTIAKIVYLESDLEFNSSMILYLSYKLEFLDYINIVDDSPDYYHFNFEATTFCFTEYFEVTIVLPEKSFIHDRLNPYTTGGDVESPANRIQITWRYPTNLETWEIRTIYVYFDKPSESPIWILIVSPLFGVSAGVTGTLWVVNRRKGKTLKKLGEIFLTEIQRELLKIIVDKGGKVTQKELVTVTEFSKSKISRNLSPLEDNGFITRQKWGNQYRVYITELGRKVIE